MDKELQEVIAYLGKRFDETSQQIQGLREEMTREFADFREEMTQGFANVHEEMAQGLSGLREEMTREFANVREEMTQGLSDLHEETTREFANVREEMAQGFAKASEENRQTRVLIENVHSDVRLVAEGVIGMGERMDPFRVEFMTEVKNVRSLVQDSYSALEPRVHALESWRETRERDPIDIIKERFGRRPES